MRSIELPNKEQLKEWAKSAACVTLLSLSLIDTVQSMELNFSSAKSLHQVIELHNENFPQGRFLVTYEDSDESDYEDQSPRELIMVLSHEVYVIEQNGKNSAVGGYQALIQALDEYELCSIVNTSQPEYTSARIWIVQPDSPEDTKNLESILDKYSVAYAFNDGTGTVNDHNMRLGKGPKHIRNI
ncbi:hypothetical protein [Enterovibrio norvegicus]|uniref:hypothetical protein n=1 Tax=Enterovibrio norvegicus TaxID=188144 RepID=UPI00352DCBB8